MFQIRQSMSKNGRCLCLGWYKRLVMAVSVGFSCLIAANLALAADTTDIPMQAQSFPVIQVFTFLILMLGPFKIIGPFAKITKGADAQFTHRLALQATLFSSIALLLAALLGERILGSYGIPLPIMALSAGLILFLVALQSVLHQFTPHDHDIPNSEDAAGHQITTSSMKIAMVPLAFPTIVTPYGIAAVVVFLTLSPDLQTQLSIGAIMLVIMLLNLVTMILTRHIMPVMAILLPIVGAVLGVVQVALGLQIINNSLKALGIL